MQTVGDEIGRLLKREGELMPSSRAIENCGSVGLPPSREGSGSRETKKARYCPRPKLLPPDPPLPLPLPKPPVPAELLRWD